MKWFLTICLIVQVSGLLYASSTRVDKSYLEPIDIVLNEDNQIILRMGNIVNY
jgi:hypothetical protein